MATTDIAKRIAEHQAKPKLPGLSKKEKLKYKEELKDLAAEHVPTVVETLAKIVTAKDVPASAKVAAGSAILDRFAGRPVKDDERQTEQSQFERMGEVELLAFICETVSRLSTESRAAIAETIIASERGIHLDYRRMAEEAVKAEAEALRAESEPAGLPPLEPKRPKKEPRR